MEAERLNVESLNYEDAYSRLEEVVRALEEEDLTVEQAVELYEAGMQLVKHCNARLDQAELRVRQITPDADGEYSFASLTVETERGVFGGD